MQTQNGHWITVHGHHIFLKGAALSAPHVDEIATNAGLSDKAKSLLTEAHAKGHLQTDSQIHGAISSIAGAVAVGFDETHSVHDAVSAFGQFGASKIAPTISADHQHAAKLTINTFGKKGKVTPVTVQTHGADLIKGEASAYAAKFGLNAMAGGVLEQAVSTGKITKDTQLAQVVADTLQIQHTTAKGPISALSEALAGPPLEPVIAPGDLGGSLGSPLDGGKVPIKSVGTKSKADFAAIPDVQLPGEPALPPLKSGQTQSAGILLVEPDGKVWIYEPKNHFAGYEHTFSKGGVESGLTLQQSAHKELYEELGLTANITGVVGDFSTAGTATRYYIGVRTGGDPKDAESGLTQPGASETHAVKLVTPDEAAKMLNKPRDKKVLDALKKHLVDNGNPHSLVQSPVQATSEPAKMPSVTADENSWMNFALGKGFHEGISDNAVAALQTHLSGTDVEESHLPAILEKAAELATDDVKPGINTGHIQKAVWAHKKGHLAPGAAAPEPVVTPAIAPVAPKWSDEAFEFKANTVASKAWKKAEIAELSTEAEKFAIQDGAPEVAFEHWEKAINAYFKKPLTAAPVPAAPVVPIAAAAPISHHVTIQGKKLDVDHSKPVTPADVDALKTQVKVSSNGETALKKAIGDGDIKSHGHFMEKAAMAQAASLASNHTSVNNTGFVATKAYPTVESLLDAAHHGDASAKNIVAKLGPHSFESPAAKQSALDSAQKAALDAEFNHGNPEQHIHNKIGGKGGYNDGALYEMPGGAKNYVKTVSSPGVAHNEHLANAIYKALNISAPNSKVFEHGGKTKYASQIIENKGELKSLGITPEISREILKGFAADVLLGNRDVLGNGDKPLSNVVIGHDGKPHRIDNGGALLFSGIGKAKSVGTKNELREWDGFSSSSTNANYAQVFAAAGVKNAESVAGLGQQIKAIKSLRDSRGGWENFIKHAAPDMPAVQRRETAAMLDARTSLLESKVKNLAGGNSLVGTRNFHYSGLAHEQTLIAHHKANAPKLSPDEVSAVDAFKGGSYSAWNSSLRGSSPLTDTQKKRTKVLDAMFQKPGMVLGHDSALSRKMSLPDASERAKLAALTPGTVIAHTPVFQSTSVSSSTWSGNVHLCILAPAEMPAVTPKAYTTTNAGEKEVLLPRGVSYRVVAASGPTDPAPEGAPANWTWQADATKIVVEAIVPGVNDMEHDGVATHIISASELDAKKDTILKNHEVAPIPNLSGLPDITLPAWAPKPLPVAPPKPKKTKKLVPASAAGAIYV
ncbi:MAG TPA: NUDIX hydrolase [Abditibacterium sp.]|jgi:ADP-ribose pyrophosphatase YjhB (NUDIX family)